MIRDQKDNKLKLFDDLVPGVVGNHAHADPRFGCRNYIFKPTDSLQIRVVDDSQALTDLLAAKKQLDTTLLSDIFPMAPKRGKRKSKKAVANG